MDTKRLGSTASISAELKTWLQEKSRTFGWDAVMAFDATSANSFLLDDYIFRYSESSYLPPLSGVIQEGVGSYTELVEVVYDNPRLSFENTDLSEPTATLRCRGVSGMRIQWDTGGSYNKIMSLAVLDPLSFDVYESVVLLRTMPATLSGGKVVLDLGSGADRERIDRARMHYNAPPSARRKAGAWLAARMAEYQPLIRQYVLGELADDPQIGFSPRHIRLLTQSAGTSGNGEAADGAILVFLAANEPGPALPSPADVSKGEWRYLLKDRNSSYNAMVLYDLLPVGRQLIEQVLQDDTRDNYFSWEKRNVSYPLRTISIESEYTKSGWSLFWSPASVLKFTTSGGSVNNYYEIPLDYPMRHSLQGAYFIQGKSSISWGNEWHDENKANVGVSTARVPELTSCELNGSCFTCSSYFDVGASISAAFRGNALVCSFEPMKHYIYGSNDIWQGCRGRHDVFMQHALEPLTRKFQRAALTLNLHESPAFTLGQHWKVSPTDVEACHDLVLAGRTRRSSDSWVIDPLESLISTQETVRFSASSGQVRWSIHQVGGAPGDLGSISPAFGAYAVYTPPRSLKGQFTRVRVIADSGRESRHALVTVAAQPASISPSIQIVTAGSSARYLVRAGAPIDWAWDTNGLKGRLIEPIPEPGESFEKGEMQYVPPSQNEIPASGWLIEELRVRTPNGDATAEILVVNSSSLLDLRVKSFPTPYSAELAVYNNAGTEVSVELIKVAGSGTLAGKFVSSDEHPSKPYVIVQALLDIPGFGKLQSFLLLPLPLSLLEGTASRAAVMGTPLADSYMIKRVVR